jgi:DNA mismatch repair protein MutS
VEPGPANKSYGLQVAKLAGVPAQVLQQAKLVLQKLEQQSLGKENKTAIVKKASISPPLKALLADLELLDPDEFTPKTALAKLYEIKQQLAEVVTET